VVIVVFQAEKFFSLAHRIVQLAVTNQHPQIEQIPAVTTGEISPVLFPPRLIFRLFPASPSTLPAHHSRPSRCPFGRRYFATLSALSHNFSDNSAGDITHSVNQI
jgi:hypothetical protein